VNKRALTLCLFLNGLFQAAAQAPAQGEPEVVSHEAPPTFTSKVNLA
jgi:hypothetical protein